MAIISAKHVHVIFIDDTRVRVARAGSLLRIQWLELLPSTRLDAISVEVINSVVAIVATEDVDLAAMDNGRVPVTRAGWLRASV